MNRIRMALLISAFAFSSIPASAGDKATGNTAPKTDLKDLTFKSVKIEVQGGAPNGISLDNAFAQEFLSRGATQADNGLEITGDAMFMKAWMGSTVIRISANLSTDGLSFTGSADYTQREINSRILGTPMKTDHLVDKLKRDVGDTFATQLSARRAANEPKSGTSAKGTTATASKQPKSN